MIEKTKFKFRGYDAVGNKGWVYGDLVHNQKVTETGLEPRVMVGGYEVVPDSVGMFSGLRDNELYEIYSGDIIRIEHYTCFAKELEVMFKDGTFCVQDEECFLSLKFYIVLCSDEYEVRVIGNKFEKENG